MSLRKPESMDECFYFSNRAIGEGKAMAWALRPDCPKCKKGKMGKPIKKNGKVDKKAEHYECQLCKHQETEQGMEPLLVLSVEYVCPHCKFSGETTTPYQRKKFQGVNAFIFNCQQCNEKIPITKKLKDIGNKDSDEG